MGKKRCPHCGEPAVRIAYGLPGEELMRAAQRGEVVLGGCVVSGGDPGWACPSCSSEWSNARDRTTSAISERFAEYFAHWDIELPPGAERAGDRGVIHKAGWTIRYLFDDDEGERFIELYATHRMTNDRRMRIYESGRTEGKRAIRDMMFWDPEVPGAEEEARRRYDEYNARVARELREVGLFPEGDINAYLRTTPEEEL